MEDKVLWIALKLFLVWLFVMAFCLCICNCLFIRSDRRKTKAAKLAGQAALERHKKLNNRPPCDCDEEEKLVGSSRAVIVPRKPPPQVVAQQDPPYSLPTGQQLSTISSCQEDKFMSVVEPVPPQQQPHLHHQSMCFRENETTSSQMTAPQLPFSHNYGGGVNPTFSFQHPSTDDVNGSSPLLAVTRTAAGNDMAAGNITTTRVGGAGCSTGKTAGVGRNETEMLKKNKNKSEEKDSNEILLSLLSTPNGRYFLLGKEERFPRIETASNPDLNVEKRLVPSRVPLRRNKRQMKAVDSLEETESSGTDSSSSIHLPPTPAFIITEEGMMMMERPRSSSFSGSNSHRHPSPYRIRITPSPCPSPSSFESDRQSPLFPIIDSSSVAAADPTVTIVDIGEDEPVETLEDYLTPSRLRGATTTNNTTTTTAAAAGKTVSDV